MDPANIPRPSYSNFVAYEDAHTKQDRIGHYDWTRNTIQPLSFVSGTPIRSLYEVIEVGEANITGTDEFIQAQSVKITAPLTGRDVLCVGKNYAEHAKEFNNSGFDSSDKVAQPSHPVIFTKRFTSIIADGEDVYPHPDFTQTVDYEGEIGVIIGKAGYRVSERDAMSHVWGYTIINDLTARERQRDHKQFYIGKSPDTFCPMGPVAVPASKLEKVLKIQTHVNGELRQEATTDDLIFSIAYLVKTMSEGQTLMPGDVLATGTPAGVGIGRKPPIFLKSGDTVAVSVSGLGTLTNRIADPASANPTVRKVERSSHLAHTNTERSTGISSLVNINSKPLLYKTMGATGPPVVFIHGLGASSEFFMPIAQTPKLKSRSLHFIDLEGHGLSPTSPLSRLSIESFAQDINGLFQAGSISSQATLIAHDLGCLVALHFALAHPEKVANMILLGPPPLPMSEAPRQTLLLRASTARTEGMPAVVDAVSTTETSPRTQSQNPLAVSAVRMSLLSQHPEGYAKACTALGEARPVDFGLFATHTLLVTGSDDHISPPHACEKVLPRLNQKATLRVLQGVGHWHVFEDPQGVADAMDGFLT